jgi:hypothetical protein
MATITREIRRGAIKARGAAGLAVGLAVALVLAPTGRGEGQSRDVCSKAARAQFSACQAEVKASRFNGKAICFNAPDAAERKECLAELKAAEREEGAELCKEQRDARLELCEALGEGPYLPDFNPANFDTDFANLTNPNPYFPVAIGNRWQYAGGDETVTVEVRNETKLIEGVTCIVVNDVVEVDGVTEEDTDDWFAHAKDGAVYYCGEISKNFELFAGDEPGNAELVGVGGSWKAGRDGDKPGILFPARPAAGSKYRQEWSVGDAEDVAEVLSTTYGFGADPQLDEFVPQVLVQLLCANDCVVTGETTPIEPDEFERKYYARGIGLFLEVDPEAGEIVQLIDCNVDPRCTLLPTP